MRRTDAGFSLIEMLVALSILAIAGMALMTATQQSTRGSQIIASRSVLALAGENVLNSALIEQAGYRPSSDQGRYEMAGQAFDWTLSVLPTPDAGLLRVQLDISEVDGGRSHQIVTFRRAS
ncbi:type II secretion system minor pseudopilin GspI [Hyphobacterium sp. CCMP332]|jgi:general secretion pathway protein I|uniref:type II secretion system minor pseudopilin GspI n=1 Tax=Hyphobacterium sp. CCMP332 TaxID=2749086 RepID=UPI00165007B5|nr:type II secretion system minor pseudopilin GspI [Hyphobacterium sp. CCMP332]QNL19482.1 type II secretion system minor pseudopilin GspI [Hyphobacterium sp. CCMP332]